MQRFVNMIVKAATLCVRRETVDCFSTCTVGKHRNVAACACMRYLYEKYASPSTSIKVQHLESGTCRKRVCVAPLQHDV